MLRAVRDLGNQAQKSTKTEGMDIIDCFNMTSFIGSEIRFFNKYDSLVVWCCCGTC